MREFKENSFQKITKVTPFYRGREEEEKRQMNGLQKSAGYCNIKIRVLGRVLALCRGVLREVIL